jgi:integrase
MGTIYRRGDVWYVDYREQSGRRIRERVGHDRKQAEAVLRIRQGEVVANRHQLPKVRRLSFADFAWDWHRAGDWKPRTGEAFAMILRQHLLPEFSGMTLGEITPAHIEAYRAKARERFASATCTLHLAVLSMIFRRAVRHGLLRQNPLDGIQKMPRRSHGLPVARVSTPEEVRALLAAAPSDFAPVFLTAVTTGLRRGELLAVQHPDLDPKASTIHVRRSCGWVRGEHGYELTTDLPKSGRERTVRVPKEVMRVLMTLPSRFRGGPVFTHSDGRPIEPSAVLNRVLRLVCARAGLPAIRFHDLRHTYVALSIAEGAHSKYIQQQLGHASITTTLDTYGHLFPGFHEGEAERLGALVFGESSGHNLVTKTES